MANLSLWSISVYPAGTLIWSRGPIASIFPLETRMVPLTIGLPAQVMILPTCRASFGLVAWEVLSSVAAAVARSGDPATTERTESMTKENTSQVRISDRPHLLDKPTGHRSSRPAHG